MFIWGRHISSQILINILSTLQHWVHISSFVNYSYNRVSYIGSFHHILNLFSELIKWCLSIFLNPESENYGAISLWCNSHELSINFEMPCYFFDEVLVSTIFLKCFHGSVQLNCHLSIFHFSFRSSWGSDLTQQRWWTFIRNFRRFLIVQGWVFCNRSRLT